MTRNVRNFSIRTEFRFDCFHHCQGCSHSFSTKLEPKMQVFRCIYWPYEKWIDLTVDHDWNVCFAMKRSAELPDRTDDPVQLGEDGTKRLFRRIFDDLYEKEMSELKEETR